MTTLQLERMGWGNLAVAGNTATITAIGIGVMVPVTLWLLWRQAQAYKRQGLWERDRRRELEAYCRLDIALTLGLASSKLTDRAKRICRLVTGYSVYAKSVLFLTNSEGRLACIGSCGMDELALDAVEEWSERLQRDENTDREDRSGQAVVERPKSFPVSLTAREEVDELPHDLPAATLIPIRLHRGRLVGLLAVCPGVGFAQMQEWLQQDVAGLELLAAKLARTLERSLLMERLIELERLAGAGHLVAGAAAELNRPLDLVLDCSELIAGTATEARVREHAAGIAAQAHAMKEILATLNDLWKPREDAQPVEHH